MGFKLKKTPTKTEFQSSTKEDFDRAYRSGQPLISDAEYDNRFGINASSIDTPVGDSVWQKYTHTAPMHSLRKIKAFDEENRPIFSELEKWWSTFFVDRVMFLMWKYDGLGICLYYEKGILKHAVTRGDGEIGEDITRNVLSIPDIVAELPEPLTCAVKAEIIMTKPDFERYLQTTSDKKPYKNTRNGAAGAARNSDGYNTEFLSLKYCEIFIPDVVMTETAMLVKLHNLFGDIVEFHALADFEHFENLYHRWLINRENIPFDVDGVVLIAGNFDKTASFGGGYDSRNRPIFKVAFKFQSLQKETILLDIEWSMEGNSGQITPMAVIEPVELGGVTVTRPTLANVGKIREKRIKIGDRVIVSRRGDVIPHVEKSLENHDEFEVDYPKTCPICAKSTVFDGAYLMCKNEGCYVTVKGDIQKWINEVKKHFKVRDIGPETVDDFCKSGLVTTPADLYRLCENDLVECMEGYGRRKAQKALSFQRHKKFPLHVFLGALNIRGVGKEKWKKLINSMNLKTINDVLSLTLDRIPIEDIGHVTATAMYNGICEKVKVILELINDVGIEIKAPKQVADDRLNGATFCVTGSVSMPRDDLHKLVEKFGGVVRKSVSAKLNYLIAGPGAGSKLDKAQVLGVEIINEAKFREMIGVEK